jgi:glycosyltransferase involved in cell wall biosynthesis
MTGIGRSLAELGKILSLNNPNIIFYAPRPLIKFDYLNVSTNFFLPKGKFFDLIWFHFLLPCYIKRDGINVFWAPSHRLPFLLPKSLATVLTIHDLVWITQPQTMKFFGWLLEKIHMPYSLFYADKIMLISNSTKHDLLREYPDTKNKLTVIPLGANALSFIRNLSVAKRFGISNEYILFVGTLEPRKNLNRLVEAYLRLSSELKLKYNLVIVGRYGWGNFDLDNFIKLNKLSENVKRLGYISDEDLTSLYQNAVFLAMPSLSEGFGLPILEAMSAGISVLTSNCSSMPEIAGDAALLVDPLSVDSIQEGLERLLTDPQLRIRLSANAHKNAKKYSWDKCAANLVNLFEEAITSHKIKKL